MRACFFAVSDSTSTDERFVIKSCVVTDARKVIRGWNIKNGLAIPSRASSLLTLLLVIVVTPSTFVGGVCLYTK